MKFTEIISTIIFLFITSIIVRLILNRQIRLSKLIRWWRLFSDKFHDHQFLSIPEFNSNLQENNLYRRVNLYLNSIESLENSDYVNLFEDNNRQNDVVLSINRNQLIYDTFLDALIVWTCDNEAFTMKIRKRDKRRVLRPYLQHIHLISDEIDNCRRELRLFTAAIGGGAWRSVNFTHPATIETILIDSDVKNKIKLDVEMFLKSEQYYRRLGRVWRRSYLLYGSTGTGKSSFVAALAKMLSYDVYDVNLSNVIDDSELKLLLLRCPRKSLILIEDFDKYFTGNKTSYTSSGMMNFMDGVLNSCCDERVMVFTTNTKDDIDSCFLRPGRIDVHIHFPNCDFNNFKNLASNYLGVKEHKLFPQVEEMFSSGASLSPAEVGELMIVNRNSPSRALKSVISALQTTTTAPIGGGVVVSGGDSCRSTPKNGFKSSHVTNDSVDGGGNVGRKEGVSEFKKLYGLLRRKSNVRVSDSFDLGTI